MFGLFISIPERERERERERENYLAKEKIPSVSKLLVFSMQI